MGYVPELLHSQSSRVESRNIDDLQQSWLVKKAIIQSSIQPSMHSSISCNLIKCVGQLNQETGECRSTCNSTFTLKGLRTLFVTMFYCLHSPFKWFLVLYSFLQVIGLYLVFIICYLLFVLSLFLLSHETSCQCQANPSTIPALVLNS